jgi:hypothetical protein
MARVVSPLFVGTPGVLVLPHRTLLVGVLVAGLLTMVVGLVGLVAGSLGGGARGDGFGVEAGNGMVGLPARQVLDAATEAARTASSVHIKGQVAQHGRTARLDLRLKGGAAGTGGVGTVALDAREFRITRLGTYLYVTGGPGAFTELGPAGKLLEGKPVRVGAADPRFTEVAGFTDLRRIFALLLEPGAGLSKGDRKDVNGLPALALRNAAGTGGTLWVATSGPPYPLRLDAPQSPDATVSGMLDFGEYGAPVPLTPPTGAVDLVSAPAPSR